MRQIDTTKSSDQVKILLDKFKDKIVGQNEAISAITRILEQHLGGLADKRRPIGSILFLGPTGTGKTSVVEALCEGLYGSPDTMIKIDCAEYSHEHEIAKLIGSPPGYLGHSATPPRLTNTAIKACTTADVPFAIILFDEIDKANDTLWQLLLGVLDKATLTLGDNTVTDFKNTVIIMTSNVGARQMASATGEENLGFLLPDTMADGGKGIKVIAESAARKKFSPEFLNRLDEIVTFHTLSKDQINLVLDMELLKLRVKFALRNIAFLHVSPSAKAELLLRGYDKKYNGRGIRRTLEKEIMAPIARALASKELNAKESVVIDYIDGAFRFFIKPEPPKGVEISDAETV